MSFVWPQYLWLLLIVPVLVAAYVAVLRKKKQAVRYANVGPRQGRDRTGAAVPASRSAALVPARGDRRADRRSRGRARS
jgi:hypothetical protein